jgi:hypothetical protein
VLPIRDAFEQRPPHSNLQGYWYRKVKLISELMSKLGLFFSMAAKKDPGQDNQVSFEFYGIFLS